MDWELHKILAETLFEEVKKLLYANLGYVLLKKIQLRYM